MLSKLPLHHSLQAVGFALGLREEEDVIALVIRVLRVVLAKTLRIPNASHNLTSTRSFDLPFVFLLRRAATCPLNSPSFVVTFPLRL